MHNWCSIVSKPHISSCESTRKETSFVSNPYTKFKQKSLVLKVVYPETWSANLWYFHIAWRYTITKCLQLLYWKMGFFPPPVCSFGRNILSDVLLFYIALIKIHTQWTRLPFPGDHFTFHMDHFGPVKVYLVLDIHITLRDVFLLRTKGRL